MTAEASMKTERALLAVVQEAYVHGVSTRKVVRYHRGREGRNARGGNDTAVEPH
jgi:hypothetical protein